MISDILTAILVGHCLWWLSMHRLWERERIRLWKLGLPIHAMPPWDAGAVTMEMRSRMVHWYWQDHQ
jgi:hypothetical protein